MNNNAAIEPEQCDQEAPSPTHQSPEVVSPEGQRYNDNPPRTNQAGIALLYSQETHGFGGLEPEIDDSNEGATLQPATGVDSLIAGIVSQLPASPNEVAAAPALPEFRVHSLPATPFRPSQEAHTFPADAESTSRFMTDDFRSGDSMDLLDSWLFQNESNTMLTTLPDFMPCLLQSTWKSAPPIDSFTAELLRPAENSIEAPDANGRFFSLVSKERFGKIHAHWQSRSSRATRLMPTLWHDLAFSEQSNVYCRQASDSSSSDRCRKRVSRWGFDDECRQRMQLTLDSLDHGGGCHSPQSFESATSDSVSRSGSSTTDGIGEIILPSTEICEVALEIYFHQFHPMLPVIHLPTFSANDAPFPMLFVLCLIGFSILGTPSATKLVSDAFPVSLQSKYSWLVLQG